jgi:hypothetical protein
LIGLPLTLNHGYFIFKFKGHHPLNSKRKFKAFNKKKLALINQISVRCKKLVAGR